MSGRVLITGAARRIGAAAARALARDGWHVIVHYNRSGAEARAVAEAIRQAGGRCETIAADLGDRAAVAALIPACTARFGNVDTLINNASSFAYDTLHSMDASSWDAHLQPNLAAPVFLAQAFAAACRGPGNVINLLDHKIAAPNPDFFSYTVAKIALAGATRLLAQALSQTGGPAIRVNGIAPGITLLSGKQTQAGFEHAWRAPPLGRSCTPEEIADACRFIMATPSLNGQILVLDGGESLLGRQRDIAFETGTPGGHLDIHKAVSSEFEAATSRSLAPCTAAPTRVGDEIRSRPHAAIRRDDQTHQGWREEHNGGRRREEY